MLAAFLNVPVCEPFMTSPLTGSFYEADSDAANNRINRHGTFKCLSLMKQRINAPYARMFQCSNTATVCTEPRASVADISTLDIAFGELDGIPWVSPFRVLVVRHNTNTTICLLSSNYFYAQWRDWFFERTCSPQSFASSVNLHLLSNQNFQLSKICKLLLPAVCCFPGRAVFVVENIYSSTPTHVGGWTDGKPVPGSSAISKRQENTKNIICF